MYEKIVDLKTGKETLREYSQEEIKAAEAEQVKAQAKLQAEAEKATAKAALLIKLGITAEEAQLLLGGN
jgi:hypothetical protein